MFQRWHTPTGPTQLAPPLASRSLYRWQLPGIEITSALCCDALVRLGRINRKGVRWVLLGTVSAGDVLESGEHGEDDFFDVL